MRKLHLMTPDDDDHTKTDHGLAILDALADTWAAEVNLTAMIKNAVSPMRLNRTAPDNVREKYTGRMEAQIDAIARQAFQEGAYRAITGLQDDREAMRRLACPVSGCGYESEKPFAGQHPCQQAWAGDPVEHRAALRGCLLFGETP